MIYLDGNATSRLRPEAEEALSKLLASAASHGNPSSVHGAGRASQGLLEDARESLLSFFGPVNGTVVFTSGGSESCNTLVTGFLSPKLSSGHLLSSAIEHAATLGALNALQSRGFSVTQVAPESDGVISADKFLEAFTPETELVSLMLANNETGALQPVAEISRTLRARGYSGPIISDITQAPLKTAFSLQGLFDAGVDAVALSGHKMGAPAGIGAIILAGSHHKPATRCFQFYPLINGGPQEGRLRAGTENLLGAVAWGAVCRALRPRLDSELQRIESLRDKLVREIGINVPGTHCLTPLSQTKPSTTAIAKTALANTALIQFTDCRGDDLVVALDLLGICVSTGSACASGKQEVSHVLRSMGLSNTEAREAVRFSLDWDADEASIQRTVESVTQVVNRMRGLNQPELRV